MVVGRLALSGSARPRFIKVSDHLTVEHASLSSGWFRCRSALPDGSVRHLKPAGRRPISWNGVSRDESHGGGWQGSNLPDRGAWVNLSG